MKSKREKVFRMFLLTGLFLAVAFTSPVRAYQLPDTGITKCYDDAGTEIPCPASGARFYGQDANYQGPQPAFRDNGNGTVTDLNTGLIWQQGENNGTYTWQEAVDHCDALSLPGCSKWRLPTLPELESIVDYSRYDPAIDTDFFPVCRPNGYWSGSTHAYYPGIAWLVYFDYGYGDWHGKDNSFYVRCVCAGS